MDRKLELIVKLIEDGWAKDTLSYYTAKYLVGKREYIDNDLRRFDETLLHKFYMVYSCRLYELYRRLDVRQEDYHTEQRAIELQKERKKKVEAMAFETLREHVLGIQFGMPLKYRPIIPIVPLYNQSIFSAYDKSGDELRVKGVYLLYNNKKLVYIGSSKMILKRLHIHYTGKKIAFNGFKFIEMNDEAMENVVRQEYILINQFRPVYNKKMQP